MPYCNKTIALYTYTEITTHMKKLLLFVICLNLIGCASAEKKLKRAKTPVTTSRLLKDIDYVERTIQKMHPDLYWYIDKQTLHQKFDSLRNNITKPLTPNEFYLKISPVVAAVRQGHMRISPLEPTIVKKGKERKRYKKSKGPFSQLNFYWRDGELYLLENKTNDATLIAGSKILSINQITPQNIYQKYRKTYASDGYNTSFLDKRFSMLVSNFYSLELGIQDSIQLTLSCADSVYRKKVYRDFNEKKGKSPKIRQDSIFLPSKQLSKTALKAQKEKRKTWEKKSNIFGYDKASQTFSKALSYPVAQDSTFAVLTVKNFTKGKSKEAYKAIFEELHNKKVSHLALDLRGNLGGRISDMAELYSYLSNEETYKLLNEAEITSSFHFPFYAAKGHSVLHYTLLSPFYIIQTGVFWAKSHAGTDGKKYYKISESREQKRKDNFYDGKLFVLIDGATFSASSTISSNLKGTRRAIFVGEETGGAFNGTVAGRMPVLQLPHTKLKWILGTMSIKPTSQTSEEGRGIMPDVAIKPLVNDVINHNDPVLDWVKENKEYGQ